jgi:hypothetical protein
MQTIECRTCGEPFSDYHTLALHIASTKNHKQGSRWAMKFLFREKEKPKRFVDPDYEETEYGRENRANAVRVLSGDNEYVTAHCPICNKGVRQLLPVEYIQSHLAWRNRLGLLMVICPNCVSKRSSLKI